VWREDGKVLALAWQAHTAAVQALAFSPDEQTLATGIWRTALCAGWDSIPAVSIVSPLLLMAVRSPVAEMMPQSASAHPATGPTLRAPEHRWVKGIDAGAEGFVGCVRGN
jgi:hypothetical protein